MSLLKKILERINDHKNWPPIAWIAFTFGVLGLYIYGLLFILYPFLK